MRFLQSVANSRCMCAGCAAASPKLSRLQPMNDGVISPIQSYIESLYRRHAAVRDGTVATYIPELAKADPDWFGIAIATTDGKVYEVGDTRREFTIQSISKPFTYGLALED